MLSSLCSRLLQTACRCSLGFRGNGKFCYPINLCQQVRSVSETFAARISLGQQHWAYIGRGGMQHWGKWQKEEKNRHSDWYTLWHTHTERKEWKATEEKVLARADTVPSLPAPCSIRWGKMLRSASSKAALSSTTTSLGTSEETSIDTNADTSPFSTFTKMCHFASILSFKEEKDKLMEGCHYQYVD